MGDRKLPDKAIDVIDESGASMMLLPPKERKNLIDVAEVEEVVSRMARIPPKSVSKKYSKSSSTVPPTRSAICRKNMLLEVSLLLGLPSASYWSWSNKPNLMLFPLGSWSPRLVGGSGGGSHHPTH